MNNEISISIKNQDELTILRQAGKILLDILKSIKCSLKAGLTTKEVEIFADSLMRKHKVTSAFKGYRGFPGSICVSVNFNFSSSEPSNLIYSSPTYNLIAFLLAGNATIEASLN